MPTQSLTDMKATFANAGCKEYFDQAYGWALFPCVAKAGAMVGAAGGMGKVFAKINGPDQPVMQVGTTKLGQFEIGLQFGFEAYAEIIFFENEAAFKNFSSGNFEFSSKASVTLVTMGGNVEVDTTGTSGTASGAHVLAASGGLGYTNGFATFAISQAGFIFSAAIAGQKFSYTAIDPPVPEEA